MQDEAEDKRFRRIREDYLANGWFSVKNKVIGLSAYGKSMALSPNNAGTMSFSLDQQPLHYRTRLFNLPLLRQVARDVVTAAKDRLWIAVVWPAAKRPIQASARQD